MCKRNLFCFCVFCLLLSSLFLLFSCASATVSAEKQPQEDIHEKAESENHKAANKKDILSEICAVFSGLNDWQSFVSGNVSKLDESEEAVDTLINNNEQYTIKGVKNKIKIIKETTTKTKEQVVIINKIVEENYCKVAHNLLEGKMNVLVTALLKDMDGWKASLENNVAQQLQAVNDVLQFRDAVNKENILINNNLERNPDHRDTWTAQKNKYDLFLTHTNQAEKAAQTVQQTAEELFKKLPELDKIIKAEEIKAEQEPPNDKTVEEKNGDMSEGNKDINENPQQPADAERTEKNDRNVTDASTVQTQTGTDGINQQAPVENTDKTNESSDTLNNQTPPNNNTKNKQLSSPPPTTEDSAVRVGVVGVLCFMLAMLCVSAPLLHL